jgi:hypothetical protein
MASLTKYAGTISQTTGGKYRTFSDLNNLKNNVEGSWANSNGNIKGKSSSPNRPSTLSFTNFGFNLPTGAEVSKIVITYRHKKTGSLSIGAPTISLLGIGGFSSKAVAPKTSMETHTKSFFADGSKNNNLITPTTNKVTRSTVNSSSFGVKVDYPSNTNSSEGTMSISYVRVTVEYVVPKYALTLKKVSGGYNEESYTVEASISNTNLTGYNPSCTLTAPTGFSFTDFSGSGEYTVVSPTTISWNPKFTSKVASSTASFKFDVDVTYPSGQTSYTGTFTLSESLYSSSKSLSATITDRPAGEGSETDPDAPPFVPTDEGDPIFPLKTLIQDEPIIVETTGTDGYFAVQVFKDDGTWEKAVRRYGTGWATDYRCTTDRADAGDFSVYYNEEWHSDNTGCWPHLMVGDVGQQIQLKFNKIGFYFISVAFVHSYAPTTYYFLKVIVIPSEDDLSTPFFTVLEPSEEELNRLGSGYTYIAQSDINHTTTDTNIRDWYKNNRIGVFNGPVANDTTEEDIFNGATYWSKQTGGLNEYHNCECEFTYDSQYPLYILLTGDYPEAEDYGYDMGTIKYDTPCIVEKQVYNGRERNGTYPVPIQALLDGEDIATLQLAKDQTSQGVVLYSFPVDETISTNDKLAIRGLQVRANIEATDNLVIQAKLHSPNGEVGNRSILVDSQDEEIVIGGLGDLWGFTTLQMTHLELWQLELSVSNILSQSDSSILFNNAEIIFYLETVEKQEITIKVEDEDIAYYGAFIETVTIPEGLNTDTSFLSIDGTDTNDAYRQNIREKTITIEFNLSNCELQTSTDMLRQLTKLFVNEKDQYNRPIPKRIQFSHYPNDYFEYIMEEPFDVNTEITDYTIKAQLTVPSGTSYSLYDTVTNTTGNANGLAAVNPIITVRPSDVNIQITESNTGQVFNIAYTGDWNDHTVEIDCEDRKVYLIKGEDERIDISKYADYNSDWFRLDGEYEFSSVNCTILSVIFNERW